MYDYETFHKGEWEKRENNGGLNQTEAQFLYIWKCHNNPPVELIKTIKKRKYVLRSYRKKDRKLKICEIVM
jgi:hypothetical protein